MYVENICNRYMIVEDKHWQKRSQYVYCVTYCIEKCKIHMREKLLKWNWHCALKYCSTAASQLLCEHILKLWYDALKYGWKVQNHLRSWIHLVTKKTKNSLLGFLLQESTVKVGQKIRIFATSGCDAQYSGDILQYICNFWVWWTI